MSDDTLEIKVEDGGEAVTPEVTPAPAPTEAAPAEATPEAPTE